MRRRQTGDRIFLLGMHRKAAAPVARGSFAHGIMGRIQSVDPARSNHSQIAAKQQLSAQTVLFNRKSEIGNSSMTLNHGQHLAEKIVAEHAPFCAKIEVAGSIRRECRTVNDIDLVLIPKTVLSPIVERVTQKWKQIAGIKGDARNLRFVSPGGFQLDIFIAHDEIVDLVSTTPTNWGAVLLCRTGSVNHNRQLCYHAITKGLKFAPYKGVLKGDQIIASATEEEIYAALGLEWREPKERETLNV